MPTNSKGTRVVALDALSARTGGGLSVARGLCAGLAEARPDWRILFVASSGEAVPERLPSNVECLRLPDSGTASRRWRFEQISLPKILEDRAVDATLLLGGFKIFGGRDPQVAIWQNAHIWTPTTPSQSKKLRAYIALQKLVMRATVGRVARNVFLSADSARRCDRAIPIPGASVAILPIGIDPRFFEAGPPREEPPRQRVMLAVGDLYAHKRFELAVDALARMEERYRDLELWIAGSTVETAYHAQLLERIRAAGLVDRVRFLGPVPRDRLVELYRSTLVFVASSRLETFGLTPLEAMACGLPVVACRESAVPEVCGDGADYAEEATGASIAAVIDRLLANPADWSRLQRRGADRSRGFAWPVVAERYANLLEEVMAGTHRT